jgi:DNA-directed RNA polymerase beta' subunit
MELDKDSVAVPPTSAPASNGKLRKRYNKLVIIDLKKRAILRNLVKQNTLCEHKQLYTQANAICRRISSSYEEGRITVEQALNLMVEAHNQMSHQRLPKDVVAAEMNKRLNKLEKGEENTNFEVTMAKVSNANSLDKNSDKAMSDGESSDRYSESYWAEVI